MTHVNERKKRGVAKEPSVKKRNALARKLVGQSTTNTMIGRIIETDHDPGRQITAGRPPVIARNATVDGGTTIKLSGKEKEKGTAGCGT